MNHKYIRQLATQYKIILGSRSPRRLDLLTETGIEFEQIIPDLEEAQLPNEPPYEFAERLAQDKACFVSKGVVERQLVIGCDTIVVLEGEVLGKPENETDALNILTKLSGRQHFVCTALALADRSGVLQSGFELTKVYFNQVTADQIRSYIASGEPLDKAGAYGIQGMGGFLVDRIEGNLDNVIGFPRELLDQLARKIVINISDH